MLTQHLLHPEILSALGRLGHGSQILLADGNYPVGTGSAPEAVRVYLNLSPDVVTVDQVLDALRNSIAVESASVMLTADGDEPEPARGYRAALPGVPFAGLDRHAFYAAARSVDVGLVIATADRRHYANLLLVIAAI